MTVSYYDRAFGFSGREGLVLMGVHAVGRLNVQFSGNGPGLFSDFIWSILGGQLVVLGDVRLFYKSN